MREASLGVGGLAARRRLGGDGQGKALCRPVAWDLHTGISRIHLLFSSYSPLILLLFWRFFPLLTRCQPPKSFGVATE
jgi:hypothetical protein